MKDWFRERFHGLYWRQMAVTVGMVFLTLVLLGVSFFSLSYSYARGQKTDELMVRAMAVSKLSVRYLETGRYLSMEELQKDEQFRQLAATAAVISEMDILVCDMDGHVLLSTDATMDGRSVTIPSSVMDKVSADGTWAGRSRLDQIYSSKQFVGGVSVVNPTTGEVLGAVFTVCASDSVDNLWRAFAGLLMMTGFVVLMISFMASSITTMRQIKPIREMAAATRQYADGDFDVRMNDYGREDEIGDLADTINEMSTKIAQNEKMQAEFVSQLSHELRTPLTVINGWSETLLAGDDLNDDTRQGMKIISSEAKRLTEMVMDLLDFTRMQDGRMTLAVEMTDIRGEFEDTVYMYGGRLAQDGIQLVYLDNDEDIPEIPCDPQRMRQVFLNLLDNAAKHGGSGKRIEASMSYDGKDVIVYIRDFGPGIPEDELPLVKKKFYKGSSSVRGTGIGLAVCDEIVEMHGGTLTLENAEGGGTLVTIRLPAEH